MYVGLCGTGGDTGGDDFDCNILFPGRNASDNAGGDGGGDGRGDACGDFVSTIDGRSPPT